VTWTHSYHVCECAPGPFFPKAEVEAARKRVAIKRAIRRALRTAITAELLNITKYENTPAERKLRAALHPTKEGEA